MALNRSKVIEAAQRYTQKGQLDKAIKEYLSIADDDPEAEAIWNKIATLYARQGAISEAIQCYEKVAHIYSQKGFALKAVAVHKQILNLEPGYLNSHRALAELNQQLGSIPEAIEQYQLLAAYYEHEQNFEAAQEELRKIVELEPNAADGHIRLAESYAQSGQKDKAHEEYLVVLDQMYHEQQFDPYIQVAERLLYLVPDAWEVSRQLASVLLKQKRDPKHALARLQNVFNHDPQNIETLQLLAEIFAALDQPQKAIAAYREMAAQCQKHNNELGRQEAYRRILDLDPHDKDARKQITQSAKLPGVSSSVGASHDSITYAQALDPEFLLKDVDICLKYELVDLAFERLGLLLKQEPYHRAGLEKERDLGLQFNHITQAESAMYHLAELDAPSNPRAALVTLDQLLKQNPEHADAIQLQGELRRQLRESNPHPGESSSIEKLNTYESEGGEVVDGFAVDLDHVGPAADDNDFEDLLAEHVSIGALYHPQPRQSEQPKAFTVSDFYDGDLLAPQPSSVTPGTSSSNTEDQDPSQGDAQQYEDMGLGEDDFSFGIDDEPEVESLDLEPEDEFKSIEHVPGSTENLQPILQTSYGMSTFRPEDLNRNLGDSGLQASEEDLNTLLNDESKSSNYEFPPDIPDPGSFSHPIIDESELLENPQSVQTRWTKNPQSASTPRFPDANEDLFAALSSFDPNDAALAEIPLDRPAEHLLDDPKTPTATAGTAQAAALATGNTPGTNSKAELSSASNSGVGPDQNADLDHTTGAQASLQKPTEPSPAGYQGYAQAHHRTQPGPNSSFGTLDEQASGPLPEMPIVTGEFPQVSLPPQAERPPRFTNTPYTQNVEDDDLPEVMDFEPSMGPNSIAPSSMYDRDADAFASFDPLSQAPHSIIPQAITPDASHAPTVTPADLSSKLPAEPTPAADHVSPPMVAMRTGSLSPNQSPSPNRPQGGSTYSIKPSRDLIEGMQSNTMRVNAFDRTPPPTPTGGQTLARIKLRPNLLLVAQDSQVHRQSTPPPIHMTQDAPSVLHLPKQPTPGLLRPPAVPTGPLPSDKDQIEESESDLIELDGDELLEDEDASVEGVVLNNIEDQLLPDDLAEEIEPPSYIPQDKLSELDFYTQLGINQTARETFNALWAEYPNDPELLKRRDLIEGMNASEPAVDPVPADNTLTQTVNGQSSPGVFVDSNAFSEEGFGSELLGENGVDGNAVDAMFDQLQTNASNLPTSALPMPVSEAAVSSSAAGFNVEDEQAALDLAVAYREMGQIKKALTQLEVLENSPNLRDEVLHLQALCYMDRGDLDQALDRFELSIKETTDKSKRARILTEMATAYEQMGNKASAIQALQQAKPDLDDPFNEIDQRLKLLQS